jgi:O-antigen/teichoic acid export membrane protein
VAERTEVLFETFVKSNRLALMWAMPFGLGLSLFASDVVRFGIGEKWRAAVVLLQVFGAAAAVNQIGFNYDAYFRARNDTRPIALVSVASLAAFAVVAVPLLITEGLDGFAGGIGAMCVVTIAARAYFLARLFRGFEPLRHIVRAIAPVIPAAALVLGARAAESAAGVHRGLAIALGELVVFVVVSLLATVALERTLLREMLGYLARRPAPA